jgi:asparagine synthase (glutamine-hydrolysing)
MFAFALWDYRDRKLILVRDRLGKKPLFYFHQGSRWAFASTLPSLLKLCESQPGLETRSLASYLVGGFTPMPDTVLRGLHKLRPGHVLTLEADGQSQLRQYWSLPEASESGEIPIPVIWQSVDTAVRRRLHADVPVAAFLSGGVDSTLVVASMARHSARVVTLSAVFPQHQHDEGVYARRVAEHFGTEHHQLEVGSDQLRHFPKFVSQLSEPLADHAAFPTWHIARLARAFATVVLTGDGGDELFAGYNSYSAMQLAQNLAHWPSPLLHAARSLPSERRPFQRLRALATMAANGGGFPIDPLGRKGFRGRLAAIGASPHASIDAIRERIWRETTTPSWLRRAQRVDTLTVLPDAFLLKLDSATMAHGLEARSPLLDISLLGLSLRLPDRQLVRGARTKSVLRTLLRRDLPASLAERKKVGFSPPTAQWMRGSLGALAERLFNAPGCRARQAFNTRYALELLGRHRSGREDHGQRLWSLVVLELWCRIHLDRDIDPNAPPEACG